MFGAGRERGPSERPGLPSDDESDRTDPRLRDGDTHGDDYVGDADPGAGGDQCREAVAGYEPRKSGDGNQLCRDGAVSSEPNPLTPFPLKEGGTEKRERLLRVEGFGT